MVNMAIKRALKANRRKAAVKEKRKAEWVQNSLPSRLGRAAQLPIRHCLQFGDLEEHGAATLILARGATGHQLTIGCFLVDAWCLGVKNSFLRTVDAGGFERMRAKLAQSGPMRAVDPADARKLLREVTAWTQARGIAPHREFAAIEKLFGDVDPAASTAVFAFGRDGEPFYMQGPHDPPALVRRMIASVPDWMVEARGVDRP